MTTDNTARDGHIEALRELRAGVEMDAAHDPSAAAKLAALDAAIAALAPAEAVAWMLVCKKPGQGSTTYRCWDVDELSHAKWIARERNGYTDDQLTVAPLYLAAPQQESRVVDAVKALPEKWRAMADTASSETAKSGHTHDMLTALRAESITYRQCARALTAALTGSSRHDD